MDSVDASRENRETPKRSDGELLMPWELVYEYTLQVTRVVEYGTSADALLSGRVSPPPEGARLDFYLEGAIAGPKLKGTVTGVDYLYFRADGRNDLHIHAEILTEDRKNIALAANGLATSMEASSVFQLRENATLLTNHAEFSWVNTIQVWASGTVDVSNGQVSVKGYAV